MLRIGIGHDTHRLVTGRPLILGGVQVDSDRGGEGHSDADALAHAIADAVLGALGEGDLGSHFPDSDPQWKDADSLHLLRRVNELAGERGFRVVNVDSNVLLERPRLRDYVSAMRDNLAAALDIESSCVSIKAKTGEGVDAVGRGEAVTAQAIVLLAPTSWFPGYIDDHSSGENKS
ncbi:MAG TPA: 2-C-methyl-D-erythritol 2,4-cyclodiphosphate synthase [Pyrinomonadaceae bacterium]|jgi:2-C-methyl-D-erythritol 2,4-cyclodiphosphate synthase